MSEKDFEFDFDFEKEFGFDDTGDSSASQIDDDFDLKALLEAEFGDEADLFTSEYDSDFDYGPETIDYLQDEDEPMEEEPAEEEPAPAAPSGGDDDDDDFEDDFNDDLNDDFDDDFDDDFAEDDGFDAELPEEMMSAAPLAEAPVEEIAEELPAAEESVPEEPPVRRERRKKVSPMRRFKNETLPLIIMGATAVLILFFVVGSISRLISNIKLNNEAAMHASEAAMNEEQRQEKEAQDLLRDAALMASGYDFDGAIAKLEGFTGNKSKYPEIEVRLSEYKQQKSLLVAHNDPSAIPNLSFHILIADPSRAFTNRELGGQYNKNFVTTDEFEKILEQLYINGYVLVDMDSFIAETNTGDTVTYSAKPLYLPDGKKPVMITETMVNYFNYMLDSDGDGNPDKGGAGFASRLVLQNGEIKAEMVNSSGETVIGNYDLVPILEDFIEAHPDFSYQGSRATLAVTGHEGVFGYRTNKSVIDSKGQAYYDQQVAGAKEVAAALKAAGYTFASFTYENRKYGDMAATAIQEDITKWTSEVLPIIGSCDTLVYARESDISSTGDYTGGKFNVLSGAGFRYFISNASKPSCTIASNYVRQLRVMVTGSKMAHAAADYAKYFDAKTVLNDKRGNVPQ